MNIHLSCSGYVYAELCRDMKSESFINCHIHAYEYFGGVTRLLVPDNLRAGVTSNTRKWDLYSFSILLTLLLITPSSIRTGSDVAGGVRIGSAPG